MLVILHAFLGPFAYNGKTCVTIQSNWPHNNIQTCSIQKESQPFTLLLQPDKGSLPAASARRECIIANRQHVHIFTGTAWHTRHCDGKYNTVVECLRVSVLESSHTKDVVAPQFISTPHTCVAFSTH